MTNTVSGGTIARTVILLLALVNQLLGSTGHTVLPIDDAQINALVSTGATIATALWAWWKNNSFTKAAQAGDAAMAAQKQKSQAPTEEGLPRETPPQ